MQVVSYLSSTSFHVHTFKLAIQQLDNLLFFGIFLAFIFWRPKEVSCTQYQVELAMFSINCFYLCEQFSKGPSGGPYGKTDEQNYYFPFIISEKIETYILTFAGEDMRVKGRIAGGVPEWRG